MKTSTYTHFSGIKNEELESKLETGHKEIMKEVSELARHYGQENRPELNGDSLPIYTNPFTSKYGGMRALVGQALQPESAKAEAQIVKTESDRQVNELQEKAKNAETKKFNLQLELNQKGVSIEKLNQLKPQNRFEIMIILINCAEVIINIGGLQLIGNNWLMSLFISIGITSSLFMLAKFLAKLLKENTVTAKIKKAVAILASCLALGVFYLIATLRAEHLKEQHYQITPIFLVLLNVLFYAVTLWHYYHITRSPAEEKELDYLKQAKEMLENYEKQIVECNEKIRVLLEETVQKLTLLLNKPAYAEWLNTRITMWNMEAIDAFKSINHRNRPDRKTPDCFSDVKKTEDKTNHRSKQTKKQKK